MFDVCKLSFKFFVENGLKWKFKLENELKNMFDECFIFLLDILRKWVYIFVWCIEFEMYIWVGFMEFERWGLIFDKEFGLFKEILFFNCEYFFWDIF